MKRILYVLTLVTALAACGTTTQNVPDELDGPDKNTTDPDPTLPTKPVLVDRTAEADRLKGEGIMALESHDYSGAVVKLKESLVFEESPKARYSLVAAYLRMGDAQSATQAAQQWMDKEPESKVALAMLVQALLLPPVQALQSPPV